MTNAIIEKLPCYLYVLPLLAKAQGARRLMRAHPNSPDAYATVVAMRGGNLKDYNETLYFRAVFAKPQETIKGTFRLWGCPQNDILQMARNIIAAPRQPNIPEVISFDVDSKDGPAVLTHQVRRNMVYLIPGEMHLTGCDHGGTEIITRGPTMKWAREYVAAAEAGKTPALPENNLIFPLAPALKAHM